MACSIWADFGSVADLLHATPCDSGFMTDVECPRCGRSHLVTLAVSGWFVYRCEGRLLKGQVDRWRLRPEVTRVRKCGGSLN